MNFEEVLLDIFSPSSKTISPLDSSAKMNFQVLCEKLNVEKMSFEEQQVFALEFGRVLRLRFQAKRAKSTNSQVDIEAMYLTNLQETIAALLSESSQ